MTVTAAGNAGSLAAGYVMSSIQQMLTRPLVRLSLLAGLLVFAYPPFPFGFLAWVILALVLGILDGRSTGTSFRYGWWFGFCMHLGLLYWTAWVTLPGMLAVAAVLGAYVGVVFGAHAAFRRWFGGRAVWLWPILWVAHEYLRGLGVLGFPWTNFSYTQTDYTSAIQFASFTGDLGVSLWVGYLNVLLFVLWRERGRMPARVALVGAWVVLAAAPFVYGTREILRWGGNDGERVTAAVLQGDIDSWHKWDSTYAHFSYATYYTLTRLAAESRPDLIVWPETAVPGYLRADTRRLREIQDLSCAVGVPLLIGTLEYRSPDPGQYIYYNAAHQMIDGRIGPGFHAKLHLVPMGEWIPFSDRMKILRDIHVGQADFTAGNEYHLFDHPRGPYAALICFESAFPDLVRMFVLKGARFLVNITNDGWYGFTPGPYQHARMCVFRAIENRVPVARSANSGISMFVDRVGRVSNASLLYFTDGRRETLPVGGATTFFTRHGMWLGKGCTWMTLVLGGLLGVIHLVRPLRRHA